MSQTEGPIHIPEQMIHEIATDILPGGTATVSLGDWRLLRVTPGLAAFAGRENPEELTRAAEGSFLGLFPLEERPQIESELLRLMTHGGTSRLGCWFSRPGNEPAWVTLCVGLTRAREGEVCLECFFLDLAGLGAAEAELTQRCRELTERSRREAMTGLLNKEAFREDVTGWLEKMGPEETCAFLVADLDDFKQVNDRWGHTFGDRVLMTFVGMLIDSFPHKALLGRYGGDEFMVFLRDVPPDAVEAVIEELYQKLRCRRKDDLLFQCSVGAVWTRGPATYGSLFEVADAALYRAKRMGKNRYVVERT